MQTTIDGVRVDMITLKWDAKCVTCGAVMLKDTPAWWHPKSKWAHGERKARKTDITVDDGVVTMRRVGTAVEGHWTGTVSHLPNQPCQSKYTVKAVYDSTSQSYVVAAYSVDVAIQQLHKRLTLRKYVTTPSAYVAFQGNVLVKALTAQELQ